MKPEHYGFLHSIEEAEQMGIRYWAPSGRTAQEVDFDLIRGSDLIAVEAKSGKTFRLAWCKGLRALETLEGLQRRTVVYPRAPAMRTEDGIDVLPFKQFADELPADALWNRKS